MSHSVTGTAPLPASFPDDNVFHINDRHVTHIIGLDPAGLVARINHQSPDVEASLSPSGALVLTGDQGFLISGYADTLAAIAIPAGRY